MGDLIRVFNIFEEIMSDNSKLHKERVLEKHKDDEDFRKVLTFLLNPFIVTGISTKKINKKFKYKDFPKNIPITIPNTLNSMIDYLTRNNSGRDIDIIAVKSYIDSHESEEVKEFIKGLATKNLKIGLTEVTANKVYGAGTIPTFKVQLAESFDKKGNTVKGKFYLTLKLDGNRCIAINDTSGVKFFTRKGQPILGMADLEEQFKSLPRGWVYDGELLVNRDDLHTKDLFRATQKVVRKDGKKKDLSFYIFDVLPLSEFNLGKSKDTYEKRRKILDDVFTKRVENLANVLILPTLYAGEDKEVISTISKHIIDEGYEGVMLNTADGYYMTKRNDGLLKIKDFKTADLIAVSMNLAIDGAFEGLLGRINVEYKGNIVGVGSGFTPEERKLYAQNPDDIIGKIVEIQYHEESQDEKGNVSLRFPTFKGIRHDKTIDDINYGE